MKERVAFFNGSPSRHLAKAAPESKGPECLLLPFRTLTGDNSNTRLFQFINIPRIFKLSRSSKLCYRRFKWCVYGFVCSFFLLLCSIFLVPLVFTLNSGEKIHYLPFLANFGFWVYSSALFNFSQLDIKYYTIILKSAQLRSCLHEYSSLL